MKIGENLYLLKQIIKTVPVTGKKVKRLQGILFYLQLDNPSLLTTVSDFREQR